MRLIPVLLLSVALATSAGCFGKDDGGDPPSTTPTGTTPTTSPGTTPTGTTPTTTPGGGGNTTPPAKPAPKEVFAGTADFARPPNADPNAPAPVTANPVTVPTGYTMLTLNVTWALAQGAPVGVSGGVSVDLVDPTGAPLASCGVPQGPVPATPAACTATATIPAAGGAYGVNYVGSGTLTATISVMAT